MSRRVYVSLPVPDGQAALDGPAAGNDGVGAAFTGGSEKVAGDAGKLHVPAVAWPASSVGPPPPLGGTLVEPAVFVAGFFGEEEHAEAVAARRAPTARRCARDRRLTPHA
jgi:hypothetical protein